MYLLDRHTNSFGVSTFLEKMHYADNIYWGLWDMQYIVHQICMFCALMISYIAATVCAVTWVNSLTNIHLWLHTCTLALFSRAFTEKSEPKFGLSFFLYSFIYVQNESKYCRNTIIDARLLDVFVCVTVALFGTAAHTETSCNSSSCVRFFSLMLSLYQF